MKLARRRFLHLAAAAAALSARRAAVRFWFERIAVNPAGRGYAGPVEDRCEIAWRRPRQAQ